MTELDLKNESPNDAKPVLPADWRGLADTPPDE